MMRLWPRRWTARPDEAVSPLTDAVEIMTQLGFEANSLELTQPGEVCFPTGRANLEAHRALLVSLQAFAIRHGVAVFACNPHGAATPPINLPGTVHIRFWSRAGDNISPPFRPGHSERRRVPSNMLGGLCSNSQTDALNPSGRGEPLFAGGTTIIEIVDNTIYILFDLPHCQDSGCPRVREVLNDILNAAARHLNLHWDEEEVVVEDDATREARLAEQRTLFAQAAAAAVTQRTGHIDRELNRLETEAAASALALMSSVREQQSLLFDRRTILESDQTEDLTAQFDAIMAMPEVERVVVNATGMTIFTRNIELVHEGRRYQMGCFRIVVDFTQRRGQLTITNRTRSMSGFPHPHVSSSEIPCLGNIGSEVNNLLAQGMIHNLVELLLSFLGSYNSVSPHISLAHWR